MSELFWPGDDRAGDLFGDRALLAAMVAVESAWSGSPLEVPTGDLDVEAGGNAVIPLVEALGPDHHRGLTSQDVLDTALVLLLRDAVARLDADLDRALVALDALVAAHGATTVTGRTLTQPALEIPLGHRLGQWRAGLADARADLAALTYPVQCGGPVGTDTSGTARLAAALGLADAPPWHTRRRPVTRAGDALVTTTDACGHVARDVLEGSRLGELAEARGGGSSSMPHKSNPVLSVLVRRAALTTPMLAATLHLAAADQVEERADGAWHAEWDTLRILVRRTVVAVSQTADLLEGLQIQGEVRA